MITAMGVGGATIVGALLGFIFRSAAMRFSSPITSFAAGVMLAAAVSGLIEPAFASGTTVDIIRALFGIFLGSISLYLTERYIPLGKCDTGGVRSAILFAIAIAIHNLPEGIAAGVGFGSGRIDEALAIAIGIALHNIPEGMIVIAPMLSAGISPIKTFFFAAAGGLAEVIGTILGYYAVSVAQALLPLALCFAGGTMLYVIASEMIPESQRDGRRRATFSLIFGFAVMTAINAIIG